MYEQLAHSLLNQILDDLKVGTDRPDLRHFYTRLGANFYAIHSLFKNLYGHREDFEVQLHRLVGILATNYIERPDTLKQTDMARERDFNWFLGQEWVAMALYIDGFAGDLQGLREHLGYPQELGVNLIHVLPILECPQGASDGGYAVSNYRDIDSRVGTMEDLSDLSEAMKLREMALALDVVMNHCSNEHEWAKRARQGEEKYQAYFYVFDDRSVPDLYEENMPEVFPETSPGNFVWDDEMNKWVMTVFNEYQWDLNYTNPEVFIEMLDIVLFWANKGADIVRLDAVAFLWKKIGTACQNEHEAHLILQLLKDCCQVTAPGTAFIAEAIVAPVDIIKYFGQDAIVAKECEIAYNATFMALLWDAVATQNALLLNRGIASLPQKLERATWLNYVRCHDDIGLGFDDADVLAVGYDPSAHRRFLVDFFTGEYPMSPAKGRTFGRNPTTGDARIVGTLASLAGLETAAQNGDPVLIEQSVDLIIMLHALILSFGGIPLLYYGDEIATLNSYEFEQDPARRSDSRWVHRPRIDWDRAALRHQHGSVEQRVFDSLKTLIARRKRVTAFADYNNREQLDVGNHHVFAFLRDDPSRTAPGVLVAANFSPEPQSFPTEDLLHRSSLAHEVLTDLATGESVTPQGGLLVIPRYRCLWLSAGRPA
ncbi:MAG: amylosucrase [Gammaproteobacteria bacterium]|jgi:amylosucrase